MPSMNRRLATLGHSDPIPVAKFSGTPTTESITSSDSSTKPSSSQVLQQKMSNFSTLPIGSVITSDSPTPPNKFLSMLGQEVNIADYQALYDVIGNIGGKGNGTTTFNIPVDAEPAEWTETTTNTYPSKRYGYSTVEYNGLIYVFGGIPLAAAVGDGDAELWTYNPTSNVWTQKTSNFVGRAYHSAVVYNGKMYVYGGEINGTAAYNTLFEYDFNTDTWTTKTAGTNARTAHGAVVYNGKMYIFGGMSSYSSLTTWVYYNTVLICDLTTFVWSTETVNLPTTLAFTQPRIIGSDVYFIGGLISGYSAAAVRNNIIYRYNILTKIYTNIGTIPVTHLLSATAVINTNIYFITHNTTGLYNYILSLDTLTNLVKVVANRPDNAYIWNITSYNGNIYLLHSFQTTTTGSANVIKFTPPKYRYIKYQ